MYLGSQTQMLPFTLFFIKVNDNMMEDLGESDLFS